MCGERRRSLRRWSAKASRCSTSDGGSASNGCRSSRVVGKPGDGVARILPAPHGACNHPAATAGPGSPPPKVRSNRPPTPRTIPRSSSSTRVAKVSGMVMDTRRATASGRSGRSRASSTRRSWAGRSWLGGAPAARGRTRPASSRSPSRSSPPRIDPRAVAEQLERGARQRAGRRARHGVDVDPQVQRVVRREARPAALRALDDDHRPREGRDQAVPGREAVRLGGDARRVLADERAGRRDPGEQFAVRPRVRLIDPAAEHGDRSTADVERTAVGDRVDAHRPAAHDLHAGHTEVDGDVLRDLAPGRARPPRADDRHAIGAGSHRLPAHEDPDGRFGEPQQERVVPRLARDHEPGAAGPDRRRDARRVGGRQEGAVAVRAGAPGSDRVERRRGGADLPQQPRQVVRADPAQAAEEQQRVPLVRTGAQPRGQTDPGAPVIRHGRAPRRARRRCGSRGPRRRVRPRSAARRPGRRSCAPPSRPGRTRGP